MTGAGGDGHAMEPSGYRRVLLGFRRWRYFSKCSISTDTIPACFKYHRNKLYFGTVEGHLNLIDFGFHNAVTSLSTPDNGRIFSIDVKDDVLVTGHGDGSLRFHNPGDWRQSSLNITNSPIVFIRILPSRLLCWSRAGDCYLVSPQAEINIIGRSALARAPVSLTSQCFHSGSARRSSILRPTSTTLSSSIIFLSEWISTVPRPEILLVDFT